MSDQQLMKMALDHLAEALAFLYEIETDVGIAAATMVDNSIKYLYPIYHGDDPRDSSSNFDSYEHSIYLRSRKHMKVVK